MLLELTSGYTLAAIAAGLVSLPLIFFIFWSLCSARAPDAPPEWTGGWPLIGHFHKFSGNPVATIKEGFEKNGPVFTMDFLGNKMTFLIGMDPQQAFWRATDDELSQNEPYKFMTPIFGRGIVFDAPPDIKAQQLNFIKNAITTDALRSYVGLMKKEAEEFFEGMGESGEIDLLEAMSILTVRTASRCLMGEEIREQLFNEVTRLLHDIDEGISPIAIFFPYLPLPQFKRRDAARAEFVKIFGKVIRSRRAAEKEGKAGARKLDLLQAFMDATYRDGEKLTDDQITGMLIGMLFAGQHTSSITSTWTILNLLHHPKFYKLALEEQAAIHGASTAPTDNSKLDYDAVDRMNVLYNSMKESLRMAPPLIMLMRKVLVPLQVEGPSGKFRVPEGHYVFVSPAVSMNLPKGPHSTFTNPEVFDIERYSDERKEHERLVEKVDGKTKTHGIPFVAFGGGRHACLGESFGFLQVRTIVSMFLRRFELEPMSPLPKPNYRAMVVGPIGPNMVRYRLRK